MSERTILPKDVKTLDDEGHPVLLTSAEALILLDEFRDAAWRLIATPWPPKGTKKTPRQEAEDAAVRFVEAKELLHIALTGLPLPDDHHIRRTTSPLRKSNDPPRRRL